MQSLNTPPEPKRPRSLYWPGFAISFALLALASCGGVAMFIGLDNISLADLQTTGPVWTPPPAPTAPPRTPRRRSAAPRPANPPIGCKPAAQPATSPTAG